jgi:acetyltransferase-like isoleucine patch superfamily enzyme
VNIYNVGFFVRFFFFLKHETARRIARMRGATIGKHTILPLKLAKRANKNLIVGDNCKIKGNMLDVRSPLKIGNNVIIGRDVEIITVSHYVNSPLYEEKYYGIEIGDYVWIATKVLVTPSCRKIGKGAVVGAGSVVVKNEYCWW